jgi:hypothetical protein
MTLLPEVPFDLTGPDNPAVLRLTLHLRSDADRTQLTLDVLELVASLDRYERELGGKGLTWDKGQSRAEPHQGVVYLVLVPNNQARATARLARLAAAVTTAPTTNPAIAPGLPANGHSFARWEAMVGRSTA